MVVHGANIVELNATWFALENNVRYRYEGLQKLYSSMTLLLPVLYPKTLSASRYNPASNVHFFDLIWQSDKSIASQIVPEDESRK